ncbi:hypothetical protein MRX96_043341 [Rhipicephalus microplus]
MSSASSPPLGAFTFTNCHIIVIEDTQLTPVDAHAARDIQRRMLQVLQPRQDVTALHQSVPRVEKRDRSLPRVELTEGIAAKPDLSPAACVVSRGSTPSFMSRHRQPSDVVVPQTASTVSRRDLASRRQRVPGSKATKSPSDCKPPPYVAVGRSRSIAGPASSASPVHSPATAQRNAVPTSTTCSRYAPRIILPHRHRGGGGGAKRAKSSMKPAAKASGVAAGGLNEPPHPPVSSDSTEKKSEDEGKTRDSVESVHLSRLQGTRTSISIVAKSSPCESSLNATHQRASSGHTMLSEEVLERMHSLAIEGAHQTKVSSLRTEALWNALVACGVVAVILIAIAVVLLLFRHRPSIYQRPRNESPCNSAGCQHLVNEVIVRLNTSVDPCDDIEAHVCGAIKWENGLITDTASKMMRMWMRRGAHCSLARRISSSSLSSGEPRFDSSPLRDSRLPRALSAQESVGFLLLEVVGVRERDLVGPDEKCPGFELERG